MTSSLRTGDSIWGAAALANDTRAAIKEDAKKEDAIAADAKEKDDTAKADLSSVRVSISDDAFERAAKARNAQTADAGPSAAAGPSGSDMARGRIAEIKQRIKMLKMMLAMMGPEAAKGIIQELRQLAGQLAQAAATLSQGAGGGGGASVGPMTAPVVQGATAGPSTAMPAAATAGIASAESATMTATPAAGVAAASETQAEATAANPATSNRTDPNHTDSNSTASTPAASRALSAYAGSAATADDSAADAAETAPTSGADSDRIDASSPADERQRDARQRQADARLADEVMQALKALLAAAEKALREDKNADGNRVADLKDKLVQAEQSARSLDADRIGSPADDGEPLSAWPDRKATKGA